MINIIINGYNGKMGKVLINLINNSPKLHLVGGIDKFTDKNVSFKTFISPLEINIDYDVIIDFSRPEALKDLLKISKEKNKPLVICTTGFNEEDLNSIEQYSKVIPIFKSANMSYGVNIINNILKLISEKLYENYDIEIIEKHHNQKIDSPSGTALLLANTIKESISDETFYNYGRFGNKKREKKEIGIHALRGGSIVGDHAIIYSGIGEVIEISHKAISRDVFALGALKAAEYISSVKTPGLYDMNDLIKF